MSTLQTLRSFEVVLESFLVRAASSGNLRQEVARGLDQLSELARKAESGADVTTEVTAWLERGRDWLYEGRLAGADADQINTTLERISARLQKPTQRLAPADDAKLSRRIVLERGPESSDQSAPPATAAEGGIGEFARQLERSRDAFDTLAKDQIHLLSVLDQALRLAESQRDREALLLSGFILYSLKLGGYKIGPYVERLRAAERQLKEAKDHE